MDTLNRRFTVAPMLDWTDRHCRFFHRLLTQHAVLYTEMVTSGAILYGNAERHLSFNDEEHPVALQLGGSEPEDMSRCAVIGQQYGYDEININVGCPSERVQRGAFGACLMAEPELIARCVSAMQREVDVPVTVKNRIGIDDQEDYAGLHHFVETVAASDCKTFIVHARKAWLKGLSPKQNREVPPLRYELVYRLKQDFPELEILINGGIKSLEDSKQHLEHVDGVMIGREAYQNPWMLSEVDQVIYGATSPAVERDEVIEALMTYVELQQEQGVWLNHMSRHVLGLFQGLPGARKWRRHISENAHKPGAGTEVIKQASEFVSVPLISC